MGGGKVSQGFGSEFNALEQLVLPRIHFTEPFWEVEKGLEADATAFLTAECTTVDKIAMKMLNTREVVNNRRPRLHRNREKDEDCQVQGRVPTSTSKNTRRQSSFVTVQNRNANS